MSETYGPYGILLSTFFDGNTGMRLQAAGSIGKDALILGAFLSANEWANMIGLYELTFAKLARKLPILKGRPVLTRAFALLGQEQFAHYDEETECVWVREMARVRLRLVAGQKISNPRQLTGAQNCYQRAPLNPFLGPFFDRYHVELELKHRRDGGRGSPTGSANGSTTASAIGSPNGSADECQVPVHQVPVQAVHQEAVQQRSEEKRTPAAASATGTSHPDPKLFQRLCVVASGIIAAHAGEIDGEGDLDSRVKAEAARLRIDYKADRDIIARVVRATVQARRKTDPAFLAVVVPASASTPVEPERPDPTTRLIPARRGASGIGEIVSDLRGATDVQDFNERMRRRFGAN